MGEPRRGREKGEWNYLVIIFRKEEREKKFERKWVWWCGCLGGWHDASMFVHVACSVDCSYALALFLSMHLCYKRIWVKYVYWLIHKSASSKMEAVFAPLKLRISCDVLFLFVIVPQMKMNFFATPLFSVFCLLLFRAWSGSTPPFFLGLFQRGCLNFPCQKINYSTYIFILSETFKKRMHTAGFCFYAKTKRGAMSSLYSK